MPTSGVTAWSLTALDHVTIALQEARVLGTDPPTADELARCLIRLTAMLKSWSSKSNLWLEGSEEITVLAGDASVALDASIKDVIGARVLVSATHERPLARWEKGDYFDLPNKTSVGTPTAYYVSRTVGASTLHVWPVPSADTDLALEVIRHVDTVTAGTQTLDIPEEWQEAVYSNLAVRCAGMFGAELLPELVSRADRLEREMLDSDRPSSYYLGSAHERYRR